MLTVATLAALLAMAPPPGDIALEPDPAPPPVAPAPAPSAPAAPVSPGGGEGGIRASLLAIVAGALAMIRHNLERRRRAMAAVPPVPGHLMVVFVPGYGSAHGSRFDDIIAALGVDDDQVFHFDYRLAEQKNSHVVASETARVDDLGDALMGFLAGLATHGRPIYLVGHSKGAVAITRVLARWDEVAGSRNGAVVGAALLDPPIASGELGVLQSIGKTFTFLPNDGGFDPERCSWLVFCDDVRDGLGREAGVEVVVFRNPAAIHSNFPDQPAGLRVYDVDDGRPPPSLADIEGLSEAHNFPLHSTAVAACIADEMAVPGSCRWEEHQRLPRRLDLRPEAAAR